MLSDAQIIGNVNAANVCTFLVVRCFSLTRGEVIQAVTTGRSRSGGHHRDVRFAGRGVDKPAHHVGLTLIYLLHKMLADRIPATGSGLGMETAGADFWRLSVERDAGERLCPPAGWKGPDMDLALLGQEWP
jgi:hypothetical protein